jgi:hypothetical protein
MLTLLINETKPLAGLFASTTGGIGSVPDISVADEGQAVSVQTFTRTAGVITDSFVAGDVLHIGIGDGVNAPVCYIELSSASPATGTMAINTVGMVALFAATVANQLTLNVGVVRTRGGNTNTIFSAPIVIHRSVIDPDTAVPTPSILGTGVAAALKVAINTALGFVRLDASARLPAVDGSQLTNLPNTGGVTSITGTANEITVTGTTTPTLSLPSALTFTGKTITGGTFTGGTFTGGAFNGTVGATTPSTIAGTTGTFNSTVTVGANSQAGTLNITNSSGATMASISGADGSTMFANGTVTIDLGGNFAADSVHGNSQVSSPLLYCAGVITIGDNWGDAAWIDVDGSASFASGACTIDQGGNINVADTVYAGYQLSTGGVLNVAGVITIGETWGDAAWIDVDGSAMFGGGGLTISAGGSITTDVVIGNQFDAPTVYCDIVNLGRAGGTAGTLTIKDSGGTATASIDGTAGTASFATGAITLGTSTGNAAWINSDGSASFATGTFTATTSLLLGTAGSAVGTIGFNNATSGTTTLQPATGALGTGTVTLPLSGTLATVSGDLGTPSAIVLTNASGTASININGTVGATTPDTVAGTTGTFSGAVTGATFNAVKLNLGLGNDVRSIALGDFALESTTTGSNNYAFGRSALNLTTTGSENLAFGGAALSSNVTGDKNTAIGGSALSQALGSRNVALGCSAGRYETGSDSLYIDNQDRTNNAGDKANALLYGTFAASAASQQLTINAGTVTLNGSAVTMASLTVNDNSTLGSNNSDTVNFNARVASDINPATDNAYDLGVTGHEWRNLNIDGTANIDSLVADTADINGGTIDATSIGGTTPAAGSFTTLTASSTSSLLLGTAGTAVGNVGFRNATSGTTTLAPATGALGTGTVTLPLTGTLATLAGTETLTNKRITQRSGTATSSATPTINTDNVDFYSLTAQAADITSFSTNLSGTPTEGQTLWIAITGTAARAITWGATFEAGAVALPTTTVSTDRLDVAFIWNTVTSKWRCMASG